VMIQNILITKEEQEKLAQEVGTTYSRVACYECKGIQEKLIHILNNYNLQVEDIVP